jgi:uncharacterized membrane protein YfcA
LDEHEGGWRSSADNGGPQRDSFADGGKLSELYANRLAGLDNRTIGRLTIGMGVLLGSLVTLSSVGAGAIGVSVLVFLYPRVPTARIVGSDIAHAVPSTLMAGIGHGAMGSLDVHTLISLLVGSLPGIAAASLISPRVPGLALRYNLAAVLAVVGGRIALDIPMHQIE